MGVRAIRHTGIVVSDMARSLPFYRDMLGMKVWADFIDDSDYVQTLTGVPGARIWMIKLSAEDGVSVELLQYLSHQKPVPPQPQSNDVGCSHIALQVENIDGLYSEMFSKGIKFHSPPRTSSDGKAKVAYCRDPEGVIIELVELLA